MITHTTEESKRIDALTQEIEILKQELEGLKDTVTSQARIIGQLKSAKSEEPQRLQKLQELSARSIAWESTTVRRGVLLQNVLAHFSSIRGELDALDRQILKELNSKT